MPHTCVCVSVGVPHVSVCVSVGVPHTCVCVSMGVPHMCVSPWVCHTHVCVRFSKMKLDMVVRHSTWVLGTELGCSGRAATTEPSLLPETLCFKGSRNKV